MQLPQQLKNTSKWLKLCYKNTEGKPEVARRCKKGEKTDNWTISQSCKKAGNLNDFQQARRQIFS